MRFGPVPLEEARGGILAHSQRLSDGVLRKGRTLGEDELQRLRREGLTRVTVVRLGESDVPEDEAALQVARALAGPGVEVGRSGAGRCNVSASASGLVVLDAARIREMNEVHESVTVATLGQHAPVRAGDLVATVKIISFAVPTTVLERCIGVADESTDAPIGVAPFGKASAVLVQTLSPGLSVDALDKSEAAIRRRVELLGSELVHVVRCAHESAELAETLDAALARDPDLVLVLGASAVSDRGDVLPAAVESAGGEVVRLGIPVDPGNLALLARHGGVPILGVPGCARSPRRNGFDWLLERVLAGYAVERIDVAGFGVGGLLKEPRGRRQPRRRIPASARRPRVGGVILAAGRSTRMGQANKLLLPVAGQPMVRRVAEAAIEASLEPIVVVLGHEAAEVRGALDGLRVRFVHNPDHARGMSTSVAAGIRAMADEGVDGAAILLGDMPWITVDDLTALTSAFAPDEGRAICVPLRGRQRGNPVLWSARFFDELRLLDGDVGGRHLLAEHDDEVYEVSVPGDGVVMDVDVPEALEVSRPEE